MGQLNSRELIAGGFSDAAASVGLSRRDYDVIVTGDAGGAVAAAVKAKSVGLPRVAILFENERIGGLLGWAITLHDVELGRSSSVLGGLAARAFADMARRETFDQTLQQWWRANGYSRPSWNQRMLMAMMTGQGIDVYFNAPVSSVSINGPATDPASRATLTVTTDYDGNTASPAVAGAWTARRFVDCTLQGDTLRAAGCSGSIGVEASSLYGETGAGALAPTQWDGNTAVDPYKTPGNPASGLLFGISSDPADATGSGSGRVMGFGYRFFVTSVAADKVPFPDPDFNAGKGFDYDPLRYEALGRAMVANPTYYDGIAKVLALYDCGPTFGGTPAGPTYLTYSDMNGAGVMTLDYPNDAENKEYVTAAPARRRQIRYNARQWTIGFLYWLKTDSRVPTSIKTALAAYGLSNKELQNYGGLSPQFYEREGRRLVNDAVFNLNNLVLGNGLANPIIRAFYSRDSRPIRRLVSGGVVYQEGAKQGTLTATQYGAHLPAAVMQPRRSECQHGVSGWEIAVSREVWLTTRMTPVAVQLGAAAGLWAGLSALGNVAVQDVDGATFNKLFDIDRIEDGFSQWSQDTGTYGAQSRTGTWTTAANAIGGGSGVFDTYASATQANANAGATWSYAPLIREAGTYGIYFVAPAAPSGLADNVKIVVTDGDGVARTRRVSLVAPAYSGRHFLGDFYLPRQAPVDTTTAGLAKVVVGNTDNDATGDIANGRIIYVRRDLRLTM